MAIGWVTITEHDTSRNRSVGVYLGFFVRASGETRWQLWLSVTSIVHAIASIRLVGTTRDDGILQWWVNSELVLNLIVGDFIGKGGGQGDQKHQAKGEELHLGDRRGKCIKN